MRIVLICMFCILLSACDNSNNVKRNAVVNRPPFKVTSKCVDGYKFAVVIMYNRGVAIAQFMPPVQCEQP